VERLRWRLAAAHRALEKREPRGGAAVRGLLVQLRQQVRVVAHAGQEAAQDLRGRGGEVAVDGA
jgi:hypothetical protein